MSDTSDVSSASSRPKIRTVVVNGHLNSGPGIDNAGSFWFVRNNEKDCMGTLDTQRDMHGNGTQLTTKIGDDWRKIPLRTHVAWAHTVTTGCEMETEFLLETQPMAIPQKFQAAMRQ